jgi:hypothetical protein
MERPFTVEYERRSYRRDRVQRRAPLVLRIHITDAPARASPLLV